MSARSAIVVASLKRGLPLLVVVLGLAVMASPALAAQTHVFQGAIGTGELTAPAGLAVDEATGDLYVADTGTQALRRYDASGAPAPFASGNNSIGLFSLPAGGSQVAVDNSGKSNTGDFYVIDGTTLRAFTAAGQPAPFSASASYISGNSITGSPNGPFENSPERRALTGVAVDSEGDIYLANSAAGVTWVYAPSGQVITSFGSIPPESVAVDSTGFAYTGFLEYGIVETNDPSGYPPLTPATTYTGSFAPFSPGVGLAVDPAGDHVYSSTNTTRAEAGSVVEYASAAGQNEPVAQFGAEQLTAGIGGIAVDRSGGANEGDVYVSTGNHVDRFGPLATLPDAVTEPASEIDSPARTAVLNGTVNPNGILTSECEFEYGLTSAYGEVVPCAEEAGEIGEGQSPEAVEAHVAGLVDGDYHFRLVAGNANGTAKDGDQTFSIVSAPTILGESVEAGPGEAKLTAEVNPGNLQTAYYFEYGLTSSYGSVTASATLPKGTAAVPATLGVVGLTPGAIYHFRVVATNAVETVYGADATVIPSAGPGAGGCPNEALRIGPSALLPECRAYEMVSPVDKNGGDVYPIFNTLSTESGDAVEFLSTSAFAGAPASSLNAYISRRGDGGWETTGIDAPQTNPARLEEITTPGTSEDFSKSFQTSQRALTPGATEGGSNLYMRNDLTGARTLIATEPERVLFEEFGNGTMLKVSGSYDWSVFFFNSERPLTPDAVSGAVNSFEYAGGTLSLLTVPGETPGEVVPARFVAVSRDGSRLFLKSSTTGALYVKRGGAEAVPISASRRTGEVGVQSTAVEVAATPDGSVVYFTDSSPLTENAKPAAGSSLYRYNVQTGGLEDLTPIESAEVEAIMGVSQDGSRVYVSAGGALEGSSTPAPPFATTIFAWHQGVFKTIAQTEPETFETTRPEAFTTSPNGLYLGIATLSALNAEDVPSPACAGNPNANRPPGHCRDVYVYDAASEELSCVSCTDSDAGDSALGTLDSSPRLSGNATRAVLDDGEVFFNTPNRLLPRDVNGVGDVYGWRHGQTILISTGTDPHESKFSDASPTGEDIFFRTSQRLVGQDIDAVSDLYDARVDGGIAAQNPPGSPAPCEGSECRGASSTPPPPLASGVHEGRCEAFGGRARKARNEAKRFAKKAASAAGKSAKALRRRATEQRKQAKRLSKKANQCRRQGK